MNNKISILFDEDSQLCAEFIKWMSNSGEQLFADYQISEGLVQEGDEPNMPNFGHSCKTYIDFRTESDFNGFPFRYPNNDSPFEHLEGDDLINSMSEGIVEQDD